MLLPVQHVQPTKVVYSEHDIPEHVHHIPLVNHAVPLVHQPQVVLVYIVALPVRWLKVQDVPVPEVQIGNKENGRDVITLLSTAGLPQVLRGCP